MEEILELLVIVIIAGIGIASKASKDKKKKSASKDTNVRKKTSAAWDEIGAKITAGLEAVNGLDDEEEEVFPVSKPAPKAHPAPAAPAPIPVMVNQPGMAQNVMMPPVTFSNEGTKSDEGDCDHPLHAPVDIPKPAYRPVKIPVTAAEDVKAPVIVSHGKTGISGKISAKQLRQAVIMSEVLGKPAALRHTVRR